MPQTQILLTFRFEPRLPEEISGAVDTYER